MFNFYLILYLCTIQLQIHFIYYVDTIDYYAALFCYIEIVTYKADKSEIKATDVILDTCFRFI